jgi:hypothetical protein
MGIGACIYLSFLLFLSPTYPVYAQPFAASQSPDSGQLFLSFKLLSSHSKILQVLLIGWLGLRNTYYPSEEDSLINKHCTKLEQLGIL